MYILLKLFPFFFTVSIYFSEILELMHYSSIRVEIKLTTTTTTTTILMHNL